MHFLLSAHLAGVMDTEDMDSQLLGEAIRHYRMNVRGNAVASCMATPSSHNQTETHKIKSIMDILLLLSGNCWLHFTCNSDIQTQEVMWSQSEPVNNIDTVGFHGTDRHGPVYQTEKGASRCLPVRDVRPADSGWEWPWDKHNLTRESGSQLKQ